MTVADVTITPALQALPGGAGKSFDQLFRTYYSSLCFYASAYLPEHDAKDVVQECFIKLWDSPVVLQNPAAIKSYLYTMVRNGCLHVLRKHHKSIRVFTEIANSAEDISSEELDEITHAETIRQVYEKVNELPNRMQEVFRKFYIEGKKQDEIADELQVSPKTVRNQRLRALVLLREKLIFFILPLFFL